MENTHPNMVSMLKMIISMFEKKGKVLIRTPKGTLVNLLLGYKNGARLSSHDCGKEGRQFWV